MITFKRKGDGKGSVKSQKDEDDDLESAKSHPSEEPSFVPPIQYRTKEQKRVFLFPNSISKST